MLQVARFVKIKDTAVLPTKGSAGAAGFDLRVFEETLLPGDALSIIDLGIGVDLPSGYYGRIAGVSHLAIEGIDVLGGVVDSDYTGSIKVIIKHHGADDIILAAGAIIAQIIFEYYYDAIPLEVKSFALTETRRLQIRGSGHVRGSGGFGSTQL